MRDLAELMSECIVNPRARENKSKHHSPDFGRYECSVVHSVPGAQRSDRLARRQGGLNPTILDVGNGICLRRIGTGQHPAVRIQCNQQIGRVVLLLVSEKKIPDGRGIRVRQYGFEGGK